MKNAHRFIHVISSLLILIGASSVCAQDWPQWRGANRDGKVKGFTIPKEWPKELKQVWKTDVGYGDATPSLVGNKLYVFSRQGEEEVILCLNAETSKELWRDSYKTPAADGPARSHPGPRSTPTVAEGKAVTLGVCGILSCLDASSGKVLWRKDPFPNTFPRFYTSMSPVIVDGMAIAHLGGQGKGAIIAFDLTTGDEKWRWDGEGPEYASPVILTVEGTKQLVTLSEKSVMGIAVADGKLLWQLPFPPQRRAYNSATPITDGQTVIYTGAGRGATAIKIEKQGDKFAAKELWNNPDLAPQFNTPVLKDGFLYGLSNTDKFYCINAKTGETAWADTNTIGRGGFGSLLDAGQVILALPSNSELIAYKPNSEKYEELARIKVAETATYAHPIVAGKKIYVKDEQAVTLWELE